jgi:pimeloyl-ACP methyl ester carboxylesterase
MITFDSGTLRVNGVSLHYEERGSGDPILCIHGTGSSAALWADAAAELAARGRAITYDRRGHSRSERPDPLVTSVHGDADDAAALLAALDAAPAIVVGRSHGGEIALDLALRYPELVRALVLLEGGGLALGEAFTRWLAELDARVFAAAEQGPAAAAEAFLRGVLGDAGWEELPGAMRQVFVANGPAIVAEERGGLPDVTVDELARVGVPTLVVAAAGSPPAFGEVMETVAGAIPSARLAWVDGGHVIDPAHPVVLEFVDRLLA